MDGGDCILKWDNEDAVFYVDPPYPHSTRRDFKCYSNEMSDEEHKRLVDILLSCKGAVVVSIYPNPIYNVLLENGWLVFTKETLCFSVGRVRGSNVVVGGRLTEEARRVECAFVNRRAYELLVRQGKLTS